MMMIMKLIKKIYKAIIIGRKMYCNLVTSSLYRVMGF